MAETDNDFVLTLPLDSRLVKPSSFSSKANPQLVEILSDPSVFYCSQLIQGLIQPVLVAFQGNQLAKLVPKNLLREEADELLSTLFIDAYSVKYASQPQVEAPGMIYPPNTFFYLNTSYHESQYKTPNAGLQRQKQTSLDYQYHYNEKENLLLLAIWIGVNVPSIVLDAKMNVYIRISSAPDILIGNETQNRVIGAQRIRIKERVDFKFRTTFISPLLIKSGAEPFSSNPFSFVTFQDLRKSDKQYQYNARIAQCFDWTSFLPAGMVFDFGEELSIVGKITRNSQPAWDKSRNTVLVQKNTFQPTISGISSNGSIQVSASPNSSPSGGGNPPSIGSNFPKTQSNPGQTPSATPRPSALMSLFNSALSTPTKAPNPNLTYAFASAILPGEKLEQGALSNNRDKNCLIKYKDFISGKHNTGFSIECQMNGFQFMANHTLNWEFEEESGVELSLGIRMYSEEKGSLEFELKNNLKSNIQLKAKLADFEFFTPERVMIEDEPQIFKKLKEQKSSDKEGIDPKALVFFHQNYLSFGTLAPEETKMKSIPFELLEKGDFGIKSITLRDTSYEYPFKFTVDFLRSL